MGGGGDVSPPHGGRYWEYGMKLRYGNPVLAETLSRHATEAGASMQRLQVTPDLRLN